MFKVIGTPLTQLTLIRNRLGIVYIAASNGTRFPLTCQCLLPRGQDCEAVCSANQSVASRYIYHNYMRVVSQKFLTSYTLQDCRHLRMRFLFLFICWRRQDILTLLCSSLCANALTSSQSDDAQWPNNLFQKIDPRKNVLRSGLWNLFRNT